MLSYIWRSISSWKIFDCIIIAEGLGVLLQRLCRNSIPKPSENFYQINKKFINYSYWCYKLIVLYTCRQKAICFHFYANLHKLMKSLKHRKAELAFPLAALLFCFI